MSWFPLPIFPEGSLASSVVTTVWVGVLVFSVMNLRFGWAFSGLVVPGYLVPLMIAKPWAAGVVVFESMLTFWTVYWLIALMPRLKLGCAFFGRDRFMAMIIVSAVYRVVLDAWALPALSDYLTTVHGLRFDYQNNLHSFGLIVICLAANQLWKTGVVKGFVPFAFNIAVTFLIVRFGLMEFTNFSIGNLSFLYEDIAASIYAAPKAYIVLITTSILASRMNLLYGWDFNGIMIPALIALQWYEPTKVLTSIVEALVILGASILLLKLPFFASMTIEGARKLLLFFTVSFVYKMLVGWGLLFAAPEIKVSDFYGFGYLLPTLMAIKMHQQNKVVHQIRITLQISLVSILIASLIGFVLTLIPGNASLSQGSDYPIPESQFFEEDALEASVERRFIDDHALLGTKANKPRENQLYHFRRGLEALSRDRQGTAIVEARQELALAGFRIDHFGSRYLHVQAKEREDLAWRPSIVIDRETSSGLMISCPHAFDESDTYQNACALFSEQRARVLYLSEEATAKGRSRFQKNRSGPSWWECARTALGSGGILQVRRGDGECLLYVEESLPKSVNLKQLEDRFGTFQVRWQSPDEAPLPKGSCQLVINDASVLHAAGPTLEVQPLDKPVDAFIRDTLTNFAPKATNLYHAPTTAELLHLDRHLLRPFFELVPKNVGAQLARLSHPAAVYGYQLLAYQKGKETYVLLAEETPRRHWGSVLLRLGADENATCLQVPSRVEDRSLIGFAATEFKRHRARALIAAGTNALTNSDGSTNVTALTRRGNFFNLAHQAFVRAKKTSLTILQYRAFLPAPGEPYPPGDLILSPYRENREKDETTAALAPFVAQLERDGVHIHLVGEADDSSPYAVGLNAQAKFMDFVGQSDFVILWLSPFFRENYRWQDENDSLLKQLRAVGIPIHETSLGEYLTETPLKASENASEDLKQRLQDYRDRSDILLLQSLSQTHRLEAVLDPYSKQLFLVCDDRLVANLSRQAPDRSLTVTELQHFIDSRAAWLEAH